MGRVELVDLYRKYKSWGFHKDHLWSILLEHPLLLLNHPGEIMHFKLKMMRKFNFTVPMGQQLLKKHQGALIWYPYFYTAQLALWRPSSCWPETGSR